MITLRFLQVAEDELTAAAHWYNKEQRGLGDRFLEAVVASRRRIEADPVTLPLSEHYRGPRDIRRCPVDGFPYQVIFEIRQDELIVLAVAHRKRRPGYWNRRR